MRYIIGAPVCFLASCSAGTPKRLATTINYGEDIVALEASTHAALHRDELTCGACTNHSHQAYFGLAFGFCWARGCVLNVGPIRG